MAGAIYIGGHGEVDGNDSDSFLIHSSETARTLCATLVGKKGTTSALFDLAPIFSVNDNEEKSVCRDALNDVTLTCEGGKCNAMWRVDTPGGDGGVRDRQGLRGLKAMLVKLWGQQSGVLVFRLRMVPRLSEGFSPARSPLPGPLLLQVWRW